MTPSESWAFLKTTASQLLGPEPAAIFLGTVLAYPFHTILREEFGMIPAVWLHCRPGEPTAIIGDLLHALFHPDPVETFHMIFRDTGSDTIIRRLAAYPHSPYYMDGFIDKGSGMNRFFKDACDMGHSVAGTWGTIHYRVTKLVPPIMSGRNPPRDPAMALRFLHFHVTGDAIERDAPVWDQLHQIIPEIMLTKGIESRIRNACRALEGRYAASMPALLFRRRIQLSIATAVFTAADLILAGGSTAAKDIPEWMVTRPRAFEPDESFF